VPAAERILQQTPIRWISNGHARQYLGLSDTPAPAMVYAAIVNLTSGLTT